MLRYFFGLFIPATLIVGLVSWLFYDSDAESELQIIKAHDTELVELQKEVISNDFSHVVSDLLFLAYQAEFHRVYDGHEWQHLTEHYLAFAEKKGIYYQIRYIDAGGMETIRINYADGISRSVAKDELQQKSDRYYFREAIKLQSGEVYISPLDLNMEHGKVERPFKPVIRFAAPVIDEKGVAQGVIVLNYLAESIIQNFVQSHSEYPDHGILLNADGYWLHGSDDDEWAFMFADGKHKTFGNAFPREWQQINGSDRGQFETENGLYIFTTVYPLHMEWTQSQAAAKAYHWKIISYIPRDEITAINQLHAMHIFQLFLVLTFILAIASWLLAKTIVKRAQVEQELAVNVNRLREAQRIGHIGNWDYDLIQQQMHWSEETYKIFGLDPEKHKPAYELFLETIHPDDRGKAEQAYADSIANKMPYEITHRLLMKDGSIKWVHERYETFYHKEKAVRTIGILQDITESVQAKEALLEANSKLEELATTDSLTGVYNRRSFTHQATIEFARFKRYGTKMAILFIDADDFKAINDAYGHAKGDQALISLVKVLESELRSVDLIGRLGGDEFAVLLSAVTEEGAVEVANRMCSNLAAYLQQNSDQSPVFTVSIGVAAPSNDTETLDELMLIADKAMYTAKGRGRNQVFHIRSSL